MCSMQAQVISPTACYMVLLFVLAPPRSPRGTSRNLVEPWWNPGGTLVEPYLRAAPDHPGPPRTTPDHPGVYLG